MKTITVPGKTTTIGVRLTPVQTTAAAPPVEGTGPVQWVDVTGPDYWSATENITWDGTGWVLPAGPSYGYFTAINHWYDGGEHWLLRITSDWGICQTSLAYETTGGSYIDTTESHQLVWDGPASFIRAQHGDWSRPGNNRITKIEVALLGAFC